MVETQNILRKDFVFKAEVRGRKRGGRSVSVLTGNESNRLSESEDKPPLKEHPYYNGIESGRRPGSGLLLLFFFSFFFFIIFLICFHFRKRRN